jgi:hypothetical protein
MVALAASDFTVVVERKEIVAPQRRYRVKLTFGDGAKTYSTGGIPLPAIGKFGMKRFLQFLNLVDNSFDGSTWKWNRTNSTLQLFVEAAVGTNTILAEATAAYAVPANTVIVVEAVGW